MEEDEEMVTIIDYVVTWELTIPTLISDYSEKVPKQAEEVTQLA